MSIKYHMLQPTFFIEHSPLSFRPLYLLQNFVYTMRYFLDLTFFLCTFKGLSNYRLSRGL